MSIIELEDLDPWSYVHRFVMEGGDLVDRYFVRADSNDAGKRRTVFIASTADEDRALDVVKQDFQLKNFRSNPVILDNHSHMRVVGRGDVAGVRKEHGNLEIEVLWDLANPDPAIQAVGHQHLNGFRSAGSVGFRSGKKTQRDKLATDHEHYREPKEFVTPWGNYKWAGVLREKNELLEFSSATVPMNPKALGKKSMAGTGDQLAPWETAEQRHLLDRISELDPEDEAKIAELIARVTTPKATADELVTLIRRDVTVRRAIASCFEAGPPPAPRPQPATLRGDGLDYLFHSPAAAEL